jgi:hypothetical protein
MHAATLMLSGGECLKNEMSADIATSTLGDERIKHVVLYF